VRLWRISDFADLSGQGGLLEPARWHSIARPLVYLADHPASALLEVLVHLEVDAADVPSTYRLLAVEAPDDVAFETAAGLSGNWQADGNATQAVGNRWLEQRLTAMLRVPSAIVPYAWNWLLNPLHADARNVRVLEAVRATFDPRLFG
jgi:RES domain-containing protein